MDRGAKPAKAKVEAKRPAGSRLVATDGARVRELELRLAEALEQQAATSEILRAIASSPTNIQPVLETVVHSAARFCGAPDVALLRVDNGVLRGAAAVGAFADVLKLGVGRVDALEIPLTRDSVSGRAAVERRSIHVHDLAAEREDEFPVGRELQRQFGHRTILATPLLRKGVVLGVIGLFRMEVKPFSDKQVELLKTFADQAVIAIENVRLFKELEARNHDLTEALEQQTATSDILRAISRSQTDAQPVFETIAAAALKLCRASSATVTTYDGKLLHLAALVIVNPEGADAVRRLYPQPSGRDNAAPRAVLTCSVVSIPDVLEDPEYGVRDTALASGFRSVVAVPLVRDGRPIGAISVGRVDPGPFPDNQIALLQTFADQAVIAIENVRLFNELDARTTQLTRSVGELEALGEVGQAVSSTLDLETVLRTIVSRATELAGMDGGAIYEYDETREQFHLHTTDRLAAELVDALRSTPIRKGEGAIGRLAVTGEPVEIRDIVDGGSYQSRVREILIRLGYRSLLAVPLLREDHLLGGLVVNRKSAGEFAPQVIDLLKTFATQSALAIQNARLFREIEDKGRQLEIASQHKSEFLANMSHELRTPLNAIIGFSEVLAERMFGEINDKQAEYLADILESGRHLLSLINDILDLSKIEAGRMELELADFNLPGAIENTLTLVRERAHRRGITLGRTLDPYLAMIRADERKVKQVLLNLLSNALKFTPEGGRIDVRADVRDGLTEISVTDTGVGIAPEDLEAVFEEFRQVGSTAKKVEGTGLGLAISRKFIELHGGRIWVTSQVGMGSTFAFTLPPAIGQHGRKR
jgi:signal transduction histidine kinase